MSFPSNFIWGAATASYQIEGAINEDGRTPSIWDTFSHIEGNVTNNENGDVSCDHYHHMKEDVALMKKLGLQAYRFSISWSRLYPHGGQTANPLGYAFYDALVDELLANNIQPIITLFHWDLPAEYMDEGGYLNDSISDKFAFYAGEVVAHFSDRVTMFCPINEPQCIALLGHDYGVHAPGLRLSSDDLGMVMRNLLLMHGKAITAMRRNTKQEILIGTATTGTLCSPINDSAAARAMAYKLSFPTTGEGFAFSHNWFLDPIVLGTNDVEYMKLSADDLSIIHQPIDFLGINIYNGKECDENGYISRYTGFPRNSLGWPVTPSVMRYGLKFLYERYNLPIYISENGVSCNDRIYLDGKVHDQDRIDFLHSYLKEMEIAISEGCDIRGYLHWSLMDNFEWHTGYDPRFGLIYVDYRNQERIFKDSAYWYKELIANNKL